MPLWLTNNSYCSSYVFRIFVVQVLASKTKKPLNMGSEHAIIRDMRIWSIFTLWQAVLDRPANQELQPDARAECRRMPCLWQDRSTLPKAACNFIPVYTWSGHHVKMLYSYMEPLGVDGLRFRAIYDRDDVGLFQHSTFARYLGWL